MSNVTQIAVHLMSLKAPAALAKMQSWLIWRYEPNPNGKKPLKVPYYADGGKRHGVQGSEKDKSRLTTFEAAKRAAAQGGFDGVGLAMLGDHEITALDFDNCFDGSSELPPEIKAIAERTYAEVSPSGHGIRAFVRGSYGSQKSPTTADDYGFETFFDSGYVTFTGNVLAETTEAGAEDHVARVNDIVEPLVNKRFGGALTRVYDPDDPTAVLEKAVPRTGRTIEEMEETLQQLDPDCSRDEWIRVAMGLHHETEGDDTGFQLWDEWSSRGSKYPGEEVLQAQWDSFTRRDGGRRAPVTFASAIWMANNSKTPLDKATTKASPEAKPKISAEAADFENVEPADLWTKLDPPALPTGILPKIIEEFAISRAADMGVDPGGLAMAALTVCAAVTADDIKLQVKQHDPNWKESARMWAALVGEPSTKKSPILREAAGPARAIDAELFRRYQTEKEFWELSSPEDKKGQTPPVCKRLVLEDTTIEAAQNVFKDNTNGLLCLQDELSGWFGAMDKYNGKGGAAKDRGFWLQTFNGGTYNVNRVSREPFLIENLSVCILGGVQPSVIALNAQESVDDGLIQRFCPILLSGSQVGRDVPAAPARENYTNLINELHSKTFSGGEVLLHFDNEAQQVRQRVEEQHHKLMKAFETLDTKLAAHIGKYDGVYNRLCVIFHCIESVPKNRLEAPVSCDIAERAAKFLHEFLLPHAQAFYQSLAADSAGNRQLLDVAGYVLAHKLSILSSRDIQRGSRIMRGMDNAERQKLCEKLEGFGWLQPIETKPFAKPTKWLVNPKVHDLYSQIAHQECERRAETRRLIQSMDSKGG